MRRVMMAAAMVLGCAAYVSAQDQACPMEMMKDPKLTLGEMYAKSEVGQGYFIMIGTAAAPSDRHATWNISYSSKDGKSAPLLVLVDANTGSFEKAIKD